MMYYFKKKNNFKISTRALTSIYYPFWYFNYYLILIKYYKIIVHDFIILLFKNLIR
jgi:hypothetical protein